MLHFIDLIKSSGRNGENTLYLIESQGEKILMQNFGNAYMYRYKLCGLKRLATLHELSIAI